MKISKFAKAKWAPTRFTCVAKKVYNKNVGIKQETDRTVWDKKVLAHFMHPLQLWGWGAVKETHGEWKAHRLNIDGTYLQVLERKLPKPFNSMMYIPRAPNFESLASENSGTQIVDNDDNANNMDTLHRINNCLGAVSAWVKSQGATLLKIEPAWLENAQIPEGFRRSKTQIFMPKTLILDLSMSEDELLAQMSKKTRQYVRKAGKECDVRQISVNDSDFEDIFARVMKIYAETGTRAGFGIHIKEYYRDVAKFMGENGYLYVATPLGEPQKVVAFLWNIESQQTVFELYGGVNAEGQRLRANYALKWAAISNAKARNTKFYDMNGLVSDGVSAFKLGFVSNDETKATSYIGTLDKPLKPILYLIWEHLLPIIKKIIR